MKPSILMVDDEPVILNGYERYLDGSGYNLRRAVDLAETREALAGRRFDAVILDMVLPDGSGIDLISDIKESSPHTAVVVVTGRGDIPLAVEAMRLGADNFLTKPVNMEELEVFLKRSIELSTLRRRESNRRRLQRKFTPWFGESNGMRKVVEMAEVAAENDSPVLIQGETGSGKGVLARWVHEKSPRSRASFVEVNCSGLRGDLLSSELFGHVKGAFTSAVEDRQGLVEVADGGTLFLDEIGDMDLSVQAQFLKVIEDKSYRRLGESASRQSDFRLITATNKGLEGECREGRFRKDLFFRIDVLPIVIPPLRERPEDMPGLVRSLAEAMGSPAIEVPESIMGLLSGYYWPGNVRELKNMLERALIFANGGELLPEHFPGVDHTIPTRRSVEFQSLVPVNDEQVRIKNALIKTDFNMNAAAAELGVSRATLYRRIKKFRTGGKG